MKKIFLVSTLVFSILMSSCSLWPAKNQQTAPVSSIYNHKMFSLTLPAAFKVGEDMLEAVDEKSFPVIDFFIDEDKTILTKKELVDWENETNKSMCTETESCGKIISQQDINIDGVEGIKFLIQYNGRGIEEKEGYTNEYAYAFINNDRFWASVTDLENPKTAEEQFDEIMQTIKFVK
ncbi:MAG: hypothetical protein WCT53_00635 [Candidatus Gracilibacteria bacterium]